MWFGHTSPRLTIRSPVPVTKLAIDPKSISFDGKTACFRQPAVSIPEGSTKIIAYLANTANTTNFDGGDDIVSDISSQANLTAALNNQVIYGAVDFKDLTSTDRRRPCRQHSFLLQDKSAEVQPRSSGRN